MTFTETSGWQSAPPPSFKNNPLIFNGFCFLCIRFITNKPAFLHQLSSPKLILIAAIIPVTAMLVRIKPKMRLTVAMPVSPRTFLIKPERENDTKCTHRHSANNSVVCTCSAIVRVSLSVSMTTVSIDPAPAMTGIASGYAARFIKLVSDKLFVCVP